MMPGGQPLGQPYMAPPPYGMQPSMQPGIMPPQGYPAPTGRGY